MMKVLAKMLKNNIRAAARSRYRLCSALCCLYETYEPISDGSTNLLWTTAFFVTYYLLLSNNSFLSYY